MVNEAGHRSHTVADTVIDSSFCADLERRFGVLLTGETLQQVLSYPSRASLRQAYYRQRLPVRVFRIPGRKGLFALTRDVAEWLQRVALTSGERRQP